MLPSKGWSWTLSQYIKHPFNRAFLPKKQLNYFWVPDELGSQIVLRICPGYQIFRIFWQIQVSKSLTRVTSNKVTPIWAIFKHFFLHIWGVLCTVNVPNFNLCQATLKNELQSCHRWFRTYSGAFWIGAKKVDFFSHISMAPIFISGVIVLQNRVHSPSGIYSL